MVLRLLIRQPGRIVEQEFRSHQTDAVGVARIGMRQIGNTLNIDEKTHRLVVPGNRRPAQKISGLGAVANIGRAAGLEVGEPRGGRIEFERRAFAVEKDRISFIEQGTELDDHRDAPRPRQHRDMAGRTTLLQRKPAARRPIDLDEAGRRQVLGANHGAGRNFVRRACPAAQGGENTIA